MHVQPRKALMHSTHTEATSWCVQIMEPKPMEKMPKLSEEDEAAWKEATKHYNKAKLYEHRMWQTDISIKIQLREAALAALPGTSSTFDCLTSASQLTGPGSCLSREYLRSPAGIPLCTQFPGTPLWPRNGSLSGFWQDFIQNGDSPILCTRLTCGSACQLCLQCINQYLGQPVSHRGGEAASPGCLYAISKILSCNAEALRKEALKTLAICRPLVYGMLSDTTASCVQRRCARRLSRHRRICRPRTGACSRRRRPSPASASRRQAKGDGGEDRLEREFGTVQRESCRGAL